MRKLAIFLVLIVALFSCQQDEVASTATGKGTLKLNINFEASGQDVSNARESIPQPVTSVFVRITDNSVEYAWPSEYVTGTIWSGEVQLSNPVIELPVGDYKVYINTHEPWSEDLTKQLTGAQYNAAPFKVWRDVETTVVADGAESVRDFWMYPWHSAVEFFLDDGATLPANTTKVEYEVRAWSPNFNTAIQKFQHFNFTTNTVWTEDDYKYSTVLIGQNDGERILAPFVASVLGESQLSELIVRVYDGTTVIWRGTKTNLALEAGYKFNVYYTPTIDIPNGTVRISMFSWNGFEEVDVTLN